ncbi:MAG: fibronectin type III domain-containing protein, partial [Candidatus Sulfotelmatobacter sp.]
MRVSTGKLLLVGGVLVGLSGCASIGPPEAPSLELPKPPTDLHAARKGDRVTLTWSIPARTTARQSVRYLGKTDICRSFGGDLKQCETRVGEAAPPADFEKARRSAVKKLTGTFTDALPAAMEREQPTGFATYAVEVLNAAGRGAGISNQVRVPLAPTLPPFEHFAAQPVGQGVMISWQCPSMAEGRSGFRYLFRIYRRPESSAGETKIADVEATECAVRSASGFSCDRMGNCEVGTNTITSFLDQTFEWENTYFYRGAVVSVLELAGKPTVEVEGDDTPAVKVFAHDIFPPAVPSGLQAVFSGPGQQSFIDLIWAPVMDADLEGYNIYRHEEGAAAVKLNTELVKTPAFRDAQVMAGKTYFYSVSAVDQRG